MPMDFSHELSRHMTNPKPIDSQPFQHIKKLIAKSCQKSKPKFKTRTRRSRIARHLGLSPRITTASIRHPQRVHSSIAEIIDNGSDKDGPWLSRVKASPWAVEAARADAMSDAIQALRWRGSPSQTTFPMGNRHISGKSGAIQSSNKADGEQSMKLIDEGYASYPVSRAPSPIESRDTQSRGDSRSSSMSSLTREIWDGNERDRNARIDRGDDPDPDDHHRRLHLRSLLYSLREPEYIASLGMMMSRKELAALFAHLSAAELATNLKSQCPVRRLSKSGKLVEDLTANKPLLKAILKPEVKYWWLRPDHFKRCNLPPEKQHVRWGTVRVYGPVKQQKELERRTGLRKS